VATVAGLVAACGGSPTSPSGNTNLRLMLTDAPIEGLEKVNIYFTSVTVKPVGKPTEELALQLQENPVDLLTLDDKVAREQVADFFKFEAGRYVYERRDVELLRYDHRAA
jgi:hypothetical protein